MSKPKLIIGISGVAQSGKDTFFQLASRYLYEELGLSSRRYALADFLKDECKGFLKDKFKIDVYSQKIEDKDVFRPFLVWFGDIKRKQTQGTFFTKILEKQIMSGEVDIAFVTDIRYGEYPGDEVQWLRDKLGGHLVHIQRVFQGKVIQPPNDNERRNDPIMQENADFKIKWKSDFDPKDPRFLDKMYDRYKFRLEEIFGDILNLEKDVAVECAKEIANSIMKE
jgi:hypothetical protein